MDCKNPSINGWPCKHAGRVGKQHKFECKEPEKYPLGDIKPIDRKFNLAKKVDQLVAHQKAKDYLTLALRQVGASVQFINPDIQPIKLKDFKFSPLNPKVFEWEYVKEVEFNIRQEAIREDDSIVLYVAASQFNGGQAQNRETIPPNQAAASFAAHPTQGTMAQSAFGDEQVEIVNNGANVGFNGLANVISNLDAVSHGHFTPRVANANQIIADLTENINKMEFMCIENVPVDSGDKPVHLVLSASPAFGSFASEGLKAGQQNEIVFLCALANYSAQFAHVVHLAKVFDVPVLFKPIGGGLGAFGNDSETVAKAFMVVALQHQDDFERLNVKVRLQVWDRPYKAKAAADENMAKFIKLSLSK